jgi:hypothetical protein
MARSKKDPKEAKETIGKKAAKLAQDTAASLTKGAELITTVKSNVGAVTAGVSAVSSAITQTKAQAQGAIIDAQQASVTDWGAQQHRTPIVKATDPYGGLNVPQVSFESMIPTDLLKPAIAVTATPEELSAGLEVYAGATRAQKLYQAGFKYLEELGKSKQAYHKAQGAHIKGATEGVKVQQEIVRFDRQNIELEIDKVKLDQSGEKLNQEHSRLLGLKKETTQLTRKIEAMESKRDAEITLLESQTQEIRQKYLLESVSA